MAVATRIQGDVYVTGNLNSLGRTYPAGSVTDAAIEAAAGLSASKLEHRYRAMFAQGNIAAADETRVVHAVRGATGTLLAFKVGAIVAATGDSTVTFDLQKDGVSVLAGLVTLDSGDPAFTPVGGTISSASVVTTDVLTVVVDATVGGGTLPTGIYAYVDLNEDAA